MVPKTPSRPNTATYIPTRSYWLTSEQRCDRCECSRRKTVKFIKAQFNSQRQRFSSKETLTWQSWTVILTMHNDKRVHVIKIAHPGPSGTGVSIYWNNMLECGPLRRANVANAIGKVCFWRERINAGHHVMMTIMELAETHVEPQNWSADNKTKVQRTWNTTDRFHSCCCCEEFYTQDYFIHHAWARKLGSVSAILALICFNMNMNRKNTRPGLQYQRRWCRADGWQEQTAEDGWMNG